MHAATLTEKFQISIPKAFRDDLGLLVLVVDACGWIEWLTDGVLAENLLPSWPTAPT